MTENRRSPAIAAAVSVFLSALLIFLLEPMMGRLLLPVYGGSASVWNTSLMVFQLLLLTGYLYAHVVTRVLTPSRSKILHGAVLLVSVVFLPPVLRARPASEGWPVPSIVIALILGIGVVFCLLAANTVITQKWIADLGVSKPFWLYAASNAGSMLALLAYPLLIEPLWGLSRQVIGWTALYAIFLIMSGVVMYMSRGGTAPAERVSLFGGVPRRAAGAWVLLSAVPSSFLMSTTLLVSNEAGAAPLFWVVPLAVYLATFVIAFSGWDFPQRVVYWGTAVTIALSFALLHNPAGISLPIFAGIAVSSLFFGALHCHSVLAAMAPEPQHLTTYYLWISIGGLLGGVFNALLAPVLFSSIQEYPLALLLTALLLARYGDAGGSDDATANRFARVAPVVAPIVAITAAAAAITMEHRGWVQFPLAPGLFRFEMMPLAVMLFALPFARNRQAFISAALFSSAFVLLNFHLVEPPVDELRSFYGVARVTRSPIDVRLVHGGTLHGTQSRFPARRRIPTTYFHPDGPLGSSLREVQAQSTVGIIGLGAGSLAALGKSGQKMYFYEIDPAIVELANRHFSYVRESPARVFFVLGDGRKTLQQVPAEPLDVLIIDAFSGDAIPTHLLTKEAIELYLRRVKPDGLVVFHISSRYANLSRVLRGWMHETQQPVAISLFHPRRDQKLQGATRTIAAAISPDPERVHDLVRNNNLLWHNLAPQGESVLWTDDYMNLLAVLRHPGR